MQQHTHEDHKAEQRSAAASRHKELMNSKRQRGAIEREEPPDLKLFDEQVPLARLSGRRWAIRVR